jgi:hypothetical protein
MNNKQNNTNNNFGTVLAVPSLCELYPRIFLTAEEKARKNLSQGSRRDSKYTHYEDTHITKQWEKKIQFVFCASGDGERKGTSDSVLHLKYFIHVLKLLWPTESYCDSLIFHHPSVAPSNLGVVL